MRTDDAHLDGPCCCHAWCCFSAWLCPRRASLEAASSLTPGESSSVSVMEVKRPLEGQEPSPCARARRAVDERNVQFIDPSTFEVDGSQFLDRYDNSALWDMSNPKNKEVIALREEYNLLMDQVKNATKKKIAWSAQDKNQFLAKEPLGHIVAHYPPISETGAFTNVSFNVHQRVTLEYAGGDGGTPPLALKMKAVCMQFQSMAIADLTPAYKDRNECTGFRVSLDSGQMLVIPVHNPHASLLHYDVFEKWPCCDVNNVEIETIVLRQLGANFLKQVDELFAKLVQARRVQVGGLTGPRTPVLVWNRGTIDGKKFGGAQIDTFTALQDKCGKQFIFSTYHMAFLLNKTYANVKIAAQYADEATHCFVQSGINQSKGKLKGKQAIPAGFWSRYHGVADMTVDEREEMLKVYKEHMKDLADRGNAVNKAAWKAVNYDREHEASTATEKQIEIVRRKEAVLAKFQKTIVTRMANIKSGGPIDPIAKAWHDKLRCNVAGSGRWDDWERKTGKTVRTRIKVTVEDRKGWIVANFTGALGFPHYSPDYSKVRIDFDQFDARETFRELKERGHENLSASLPKVSITLTSSPVYDKVSLLDSFYWPESRKVLLVKVTSPGNSKTIRVKEDFGGYRFYVYGGALLSPVIQDVSDEDLPKDVNSATGATATSPQSAITTENQLEITSVPVDNPTGALDSTDVSSTIAGPPVPISSPEIVAAAAKINFNAHLLHSHKKTKETAKRMLKEYGCSQKGNVKILVRRLARFVQVHNEHLEMGSEVAQRLGRFAAYQIN